MPKPGEGPLPEEIVPALTQASLLIRIPSGKGPVELGMRLGGEVAGRAWTVGLASAVPKSGGKRATLVVAGVQVQAGLHEMPVFGPRIPENLAKVRALGLCAHTGKIAAGDVQGLLALVPGEAGSFPAPTEQALTGKVAAGVEVELGGAARGVWASLDGTKDKKKRSRATKGGKRTPALMAGDGPTGGADVAATGWVEVNTEVGPLRLRRLGVAFGGKRLRLMADASVKLGGLVFDAVGLGLAVELQGSYKVEGTLDGLGLAWRADPVTIAGALVRMEDKSGLTRLYIGGLVVIKTPQITFAAAGMYAELQSGATSVFVIGEVAGLRIPVGPVEITGVLGGFGYNSHLAIPDAPEQVATFPLVAGLADSGVISVADGPAKTLEKLGTLITPAQGEIWLAAGLEFTVFELVKANVVVGVAVAPDDLTVVVLGVARAQFPLKGTAYVKATLGLRAIYRKSTGELSVRGALAPSESYLIDPGCRLMGGFAVATWVEPSPHAGDFVITMGGYLPGYAVPEHYPKVDPIGFDWQVNDSLSINGGCYAAVTPRMLMVGGHLKVAFTSDLVEASLEAHVNALIQWDPFYFLVDIGISVRVVVHVAIVPDLNLHVSLTVWGPPTGGTATLELPVVPDITIHFGADKPSKPSYLDWPAFHERTLGNQKLQVVPVDGMLREQSATDGKPPDKAAVPRVSAHGFAVIARSPVPCSAIGTKAPSGAKPLALQGAGPISIRPMNVSQAASDATLSISHTPLGTTTTSLVDVSAWRLEPVRQNVPVSVWGEPLKSADEPVRPGQELLPDRLMGATLTVPAPRAGDVLGPMPKSRLEHEGDNVGVLPLGEVTSDQQVITVGKARQEACQGLKTTAAQRVALCDELARLGLRPGDQATPPVDALGEYGSRAWSYLDADPLMSAGPPQWTPHEEPPTIVTARPEVLV
ncbi:DUF6603 domain-containing protein [Nonomuraea sp. NPDC001699]